jgi:steroid 5-alpha reductase family enzyme
MTNTTTYFATCFTTLELLSKYIGSIQESLTSGSNIVALSVLSGVAIMTMIPLTLLVRRSHCFTVGYGAAIAMMAFTMILAFGQQTCWSSKLLVYVALLYGVRLTVFLGWRQVSVKSMREQTMAFDESFTAAAAIPLTVGLGVLYASMISPVLFVLRAAAPKDEAFSAATTWFGIGLAYSGFLVEAVADQHKLYTKGRHNTGYGEKRFVGPTNGLYALCRHPNYLGELMLWTGIWLAGLGSFVTNITAWSAATVGYVSICFIMQDSADRLDKKQEHNYRGQQRFEQWRQRVHGSLVPLPAFLLSHT